MAKYITAIERRWYKGECKIVKCRWCPNFEPHISIRDIGTCTYYKAPTNINYHCYKIVEIDNVE